MSYAAAMEERRWLVAGSDMRTVARRRVVGSFVDALLVVVAGADEEGWLC